MYRLSCALRGGHRPVSTFLHNRQNTGGDQSAKENRTNEEKFGCNTDSTQPPPKDHSQTSWTLDKSLLLAVGGGCSVAICHDRQSANDNSAQWMQQGHDKQSTKWTTTSITSLLTSNTNLNVLPSLTSSNITEVSTPEKSSIQAASDDLSKFVQTCRDSLNNSLGFDLLKSGMSAEAIAHFELAPDHLPAVYNRAMCYAFGRGTRKNMKKAVEMWQKACDHGHAASCYQLGVCHVRGLGGLDANVHKGRSLIELAAAGSFPQAQLYVGLLLLKEGDYTRGVESIKKAIDAKNSDAITLVKSWLHDDNTTQSIPESIRIQLLECFDDDESMSASSSSRQFSL